MHLAYNVELSWHSTSFHVGWVSRYCKTTYSFFFSQNRDHKAPRMLPALLTLTRVKVNVGYFNLRLCLSLPTRVNIYYRKPNSYTSFFFFKNTALALLQFLHIPRMTSEDLRPCCTSMAACCNWGRRHVAADNTWLRDAILGPSSDCCHNCRNNLKKDDVFSRLSQPNCVTRHFFTSMDHDMAFALVVWT